LDGLGEVGRAQALGLAKGGQLEAAAGLVEGGVQRPPGVADSHGRLGGERLGQLGGD
jgi:hypothetical protein